MGFGVQVGDIPVPPSCRMSYRVKEPMCKVLIIMVLNNETTAVFTHPTSLILRQGAQPTHGFGEGRGILRSNREAALRLANQIVACIARLQDRFCREHVIE